MTKTSKKKHLIKAEISARENAENNLCDDESTARVLLNAATTDFAALIDGEGVVLDANETMAARFGMPLGELIGVCSWNLLSPEIAKRRKAYADEVIRTGNPIHFEDQRKGSWFDHMYYPVFDKKKRVTKIAVIARDITERKKMEEALWKSEETFRTIAETSSVAIYLTDEKGKCVYANPLWLHHAGLTMDEALGDGWTKALHPEDRDSVFANWKKMVASQGNWGLEYRFVSQSDGTVYWLWGTASRITGEKGETTGYVGVNVDITERKKAEDSLKQLKDRLEKENVYLREEVRNKHNFSDIIGNSEGLRYVLFRIEQVASADTTVLILGETGTGKELIARAIHNTSSRKDMPMIKVNCAALPSYLIESELFGHEKGAFTGAVENRIGRFELADGATIFLDEIGELPLDLQPKLLRVLQDGEFERLGSSKTIKTNARVITATNRNLEKMVEKGRFRRDLYYRLDIYPLTVPPLRHRREDIPMLVDTFIRRYNKKLGKNVQRISKATMDELQAYSWPGNVRELQNTIERAVIISPDDRLRIDIPVTPHSIIGDDSVPDKTLDEIDREYIQRVLKSKSWRIEGPRGAAIVLGLNPSTLRFRMRKLGIERPR